MAITAPFNVSAKQELLGQVITWDIVSKSINVIGVRNALTAAGLPDVTSDLNPMAAFGRATRYLKDSRTIDKVHEGKDGVICFQLTKKQVVGNMMHFDYETKITLNSHTGEITCESEELQAKVRSLFDMALNIRTASDITRMVQRLFKEHADLFAINPKKGVAYFVPQRFAEFVDQVESFMLRVGGSVWRFPVPKGTTEGNKSVKEAVAAGLRGMIDEIKEHAAEWNATTQVPTIKRKIEAWHVIKHKAESYAEYLQSETESLMAEVNEAKLAITAKVASLSESS